MKIPTSVPETGFYYHYKHDPNGPINNYAYELVGIGCHTEEDCRPEDSNLAIYRPLYENTEVYRAGKLVWVRPLEMFTGTVEKAGNIPRFSKVTDSEILMQLTEIRDKMYRF
jgi:hypothetical protein